MKNTTETNAIQKHTPGPWVQGCDGCNMRRSLGEYELCAYHVHAVNAYDKNQETIRELVAVSKALIACAGNAENWTHDEQQGLAHLRKSIARASPHIHNDADEYRREDEQVDESLTANEYEFTEDGKIA